MMALTKKIFIAIALILYSSVIYAQKKVEETIQSMVVLSENNIVSLVKTLRKHKKDKAVNNAYNLELDSIESEASYNNDYLKSQIDHLYNQQPVYGSSKTDPNNALLAKRLNALENEISQLNYAIKQFSASNKNVVISAMPENDPVRIIEVPQTVYVKDIASVNNKTDKKLQRQLDSLRTVFKNSAQPTNANYAGDFKAIQERIDALKKSMQDKSNAPSNYDVLLSKYKGYNKVIYFADNSKTLNLNASNIIEELFSILDTNENLDVIVKGFASNKGNAIYNENLSMQRTEAVKRALMLRGIHPTRVLTQYHGIDYNAPREAEARRVEVSVLVRK